MASDVNPLTRLLVSTLVAGLLALSGAASARADAITPAELATVQAELGGFNLILSGSLSSNTETEGQAVIGGNVSGQTQFCFNGCQGNSDGYAALTVYGNINGPGVKVFSGDIRVGGSINGATVSLQSGGGAAYVAGNNSGQIQGGNLYISGSQNGSVQAPGTAYTGQPQSTTFPYGSFATAFGTPLGNLSATLATLTPTATITTPSNNFVFNTASGVMENGVLVTVYQISASTLASMSNIQGFNLSGSDIIIINVLGSTTSLPNLSNYAGAAGVIWNFPDETGNLTFDGAWAGSVLAPNANVTNDGDFTGTLVAASLTQDSELHSAPFTGNLSFLDSVVATPEPASLTLMAGMLPVLALLRRRRR
jgi:choice-of-anchor A domain-containing protein